MIVFNDSCFWTSTGPIEVTINGSCVGALRRYEYLQAAIGAGSHVIVVRHKEFLFPKHYRDTYEFTITDPVGLSIRVFTRLTSTGVALGRIRPSDFAKRFRLIRGEDIEELTASDEPAPSSNPYSAPRSQ